MSIAAVVARMRKDPSYQRLAFEAWTLQDGSAGQVVVLDGEDYKPALIALRAGMARAYMKMARDELDGVVPDFLKNLQA